MSRQQRQAIDALMRAPRIPPVTVEELREGFAAARASMPVPDGVHTSPVVLGPRPALRVDPPGDPAPGAILYLHGGGFVAGSPRTSLTMTANLVASTGIPAFSLDYRLAPEHPFPAAVDDTLAAYQALLKTVPLPGGGSHAQIAVVGDSAGGNLAVTTCLGARAGGLPMPEAVVTFSAGLDFTYSGSSMRTKEGIDPLFTRAKLRAGLAPYVGHADPEHPLLSPALTADVTGFPPALLQVGTNEVLLDDSVRMAARLRDAGVDVVLDVVADVPHVFQAFAGTLDEADEALQRAARFIAQYL
ncbi:alpha/beta hydrolase [Kineosporia mesophila]|uniref:Alpha/beta hydrolase n=1 Tax=Kineosporia mesophila TaxID=566012 RepID=A0ABP7APQ3_9ACTN|nr:alpha/beta hydrolase [Kineosporia mesophila]MCD5349279.1 alpha/beta hydrolase [Kineosporia mesophila]